MARGFTAALRHAMRLGCTVVCSVAPYDGEPVTLDPRDMSDPKPWVLTAHLESKDAGTYRYSGRECHVREES